MFFWVKVNPEACSAAAIRTANGVAGTQERGEIAMMLLK
jgi:hypothetical protein